MIIAEGSSPGTSSNSSMIAYHNAMDQFDDDYDGPAGLINWLAENMEGSYKFDDIYEEDEVLIHYNVKCCITLTFQLDTDEMAFKLRWL